MVDSSPAQVTSGFSNSCTELTTNPTSVWKWGIRYTQKKRYSKMTCGKLLRIRWNWMTQVPDRPIWVGSYHIDVFRSDHPALHELFMAE